MSTLQQSSYVYGKKYDNHKDISSCKNYTYNTLLMLTWSTIMWYIIYHFN